MNKSSLHALCMCTCACSVLTPVSQGYAESGEIHNSPAEYDERLRLPEDGDDHAREHGHEDRMFNPAISVVLDGVFSSYSNDPADYNMPGYALGREAGLAAEGFSLGHSEIIFRSTIDNKFYGQFSVSIAEHHDNIEVELEEAFFETLSLGGGFNIRGGRFYSAIGYLNQQHRHEWDFYDAPLVYRGLFGDQYFDV